MFMNHSYMFRLPQYIHHTAVENHKKEITLRNNYNNLLPFKKLFSLQTYKHIFVYMSFLLQGQDFAHNVYVNNFLFMIPSGLMMARLKWPKHLAMIHKNIYYVLD